jgi:hypothetical protein
MAKEEKPKWEMAKWEKAKREYTAELLLPHFKFGPENPEVYIHA